MTMRSRTLGGRIVYASVCIYACARAYIRARYYNIRRITRIIRAAQRSGTHKPPMPPRIGGEFSGRPSKQILMNQIMRRGCVSVPLNLALSLCLSVSVYQCSSVRVLRAYSPSKITISLGDIMYFNVFVKVN